MTAGVWRVYFCHAVSFCFVCGSLEIRQPNAYSSLDLTKLVQVFKIAGFYNGLFDHF